MTQANNIPRNRTDQSIQDTKCAGRSTIVLWIHIHFESGQRCEVHSGGLVGDGWGWVGSKFPERDGIYSIGGKYFTKAK